MSVLQSTPFPGFVEAVCLGCQTALLLPHAEHQQVRYCRRCEHSMQDAEAGRIASLVRELAAGEAPCFNLLTEDERRVHLSMIAVAVEYARVVTLGGNPPSKHHIISLAHYESLASDEPSDAEKLAMYAAEEDADRELTLAGEEQDGERWDSMA